VIAKVHALHGMSVQPGHQLLSDHVWAQAIEADEQKCCWGQRHYFSPNLLNVPTSTVNTSFSHCAQVMAT
jgi:hypothetical protein